MFVFCFKLYHLEEFHNSVLLGTLRETLLPIMPQNRKARLFLSSSQCLKPPMREGAEKVVRTGEVRSVSGQK